MAGMVQESITIEPCAHEVRTYRLVGPVDQKVAKHRCNGVQFLERTRRRSRNSMLANGSGTHKGPASFFWGSCVWPVATRIEFGKTPCLQRVVLDRSYV